MYGFGEEEIDDDDTASLFMSEDGDDQGNKEEPGHEHGEAVEEQVDPNQSEEGHKARGMPSPEQPTRQEVEEHELAHVPFRQWCVHCQRGR